MKKIQLAMYFSIGFLSLGVADMPFPMIAQAMTKQGDSRTSDPASGDDLRVGAVETISEGVAGVVVDARGAPIPGALIQPMATSGSGPIPDMAVMSGADGRFTWKLKPGSYRIDAIVDGRVVASANVRVTGGELTSIQLSAGQ